MFVTVKIESKTVTKEIKYGDVPMLDVKQATKVFSAGTASEHHALNGLNLHLDDGEFVTIIGSNGAGKSTLFNAICGNYWLDRGQIFLDGQDITFLSEHRRARQIGRVFQDPMKGTAPHLTIEENLALAYTRKDRKPFRSAVRKQEKDLFRTELEKYHMDLENRMKTKVGLLSGGQRQVVTLLMCTLVMPKLLLLDEHTAALDPATADKVMEITRSIVSENHLTTLMITHNLSQALTTGNRTLMLDEGRIILDLGGEERAKMGVNDLLDCYAEKKKKAFDNDRMMLA